MQAIDEAKAHCRFAGEGGGAAGVRALPNSRGFAIASLVKAREGGRALPFCVTFRGCCTNRGCALGVGAKAVRTTSCRYSSTTAPPFAETRISAPGGYLPAMMFFAIGFSSSRWIALFTGRAPKAGS